MGRTMANGESWEGEPRSGAQNVWEGQQQQNGGC